jgi:hypothetical protein
MKGLITESCIRFGIRLKDVRFFFEDQRVLFNHTPAELGMEEVTHFGFWNLILDVEVTNFFLKF